MGDKRKEKLCYWGAFFGSIVGLVIAKTYQAWAILFVTQGMRLANVSGWKGGINTPFWIWATEKPVIFLWVVVTIFILVGLLFTKFLVEE